MRSCIARPGYESWVGVDHEVLRYVRALEVEIGNFDARLENLGIEHREEVTKLQRQLVAKDREIGRLSPRARARPGAPEYDVAQFFEAAVTRSALGTEAGASKARTAPARWTARARVSSSRALPGRYVHIRHGP